MFNLYQLVTGAHGGQGLDSLAGQFGLSRQQADSAVQALIPALSTAFMTKASMPGGLGDIAGAMTDGHHQQAYADPGAAQGPATQQKGGDVLGNIFGSSGIVNTVVQHASTLTGIAPDTLQAMLPVIVSMIVGGASTMMHEQGMGGMLGQLAQGGLGSILGQFGGAGGGTAGGFGGGFPGGTGGGLGGSAAEGGFAGMIGNIFNSFFGGGGAASQPAPAPQPTPARPAAQDGSDILDQPGAAGAGGAGALPPLVQAGMDQLFKMFQPGVAGQGAQPGNLADMISATLGGRR